MVKLALVSYGLFVRIYLCSAQVVVKGKCPEVTIVTDFDVNKFTGKWYEARRYFSILEEGSRCNSAKYAITPEDKMMSISYSLVNSDGSLYNLRGDSSFADNPFHAKFMIKIPGIQHEDPLLILGTDYNNFAVLWSCNEMALYHTERAGIITRDRNTSDGMLEEAYRIFEKNNLSKDRLISSVQANC